MRTIHSMVVYSSNGSAWVAEDQEFYLCPSYIVGSVNARLGYMRLCRGESLSVCVT